MINNKFLIKQTEQDKSSVCVCLSAVGVHQDGGRQSSGEDRWRKVFKVNTKFTSQVLCPFFCVVLFEMMIVVFPDIILLLQRSRPAAASHRTSSVSTCPSSWQVKKQKKSRHVDAKIQNQKSVLMFWCSSCSGRYNKFCRSLPQTPWVIDGERRMESSVEELIAAPILSSFRSDGESTLWRSQHFVERDNKLTLNLFWWSQFFFLCCRF